MKKVITVLAVILLLAVIVPAGLGCPKPPAEVATTLAVAEPPSEFEVSGTMEVIKSLIDPNPKIENSEWTLRNTEYWEVHGGLEGMLVFDFIIVVDITTVKFTIDGVGTFTGEVEGRSGSYVYSTVGSGQFTSPTGESGTVTGENTIISGTGELANLRGSLHSEFKFDKNGVTGTYSGTLRFGE
jgi:hypothetical protein